MATRANPRRFGPYQVVDELGRGAMGVVFRVRHEVLGTDRALKILNRQDPKRSARFLREAKNLAKVQHPNVVGIHEVGEQEGLLYFAMDLVEGEPLDRILGRRRFPWDEALGLAVGLSRGVAALHEAGVVHRDLKPQNIVIAPDGRPVVLDLGLAIAPDFDDRLTKTGGMVGTPLYMAPEQYERTTKEPTPATDVFALGLIVFELLTGSYPVEVDSAVTPAQILFSRQPRPSDRDGDLPAEVDTIFARATAKDAADRYASAAELGDALQALRDAPGPTGRQLRQRKLLLIGVTGALVVIAGTLAGLVVARGDSAPPVPSPSVEPSATPRSSPMAVPSPALGEAATRAGTRRWREIKKLPPKQLLPLATSWLERYRGHSLAAEVQAAKRSARLAFPIATLPEAEYIQPAWAGRRLIALERRTQVTTVWEVEPELRRVGTWPRVRAIRTIVLALPSGRLAALSAGVGMELLEPDGTVVRTLTLPNQARGVTRLVVTHDEARVGVAKTKKAWVVDVASGATKGPLEMGGNSVRGIAFSPSGLQFAAVFAMDGAGRENGLQVWDSRSGELQWSSAVSFHKPFAVAFERSGERIIVGTAGNRVRYFSARDGRPGDQLHGTGAKMAGGGFDPVAPAHNGSIQDVVVLSDGRILTVGGDPALPTTSNELRFWGEDGTELHRVLDQPEPLISAAVTRDAPFLAAVRTLDGGVQVWALPE